MRLDRSFFYRDALTVAPDLLGKALVRKDKERISSHTISEVEVYLGIEDQASHARFGKTARNAVMFDQGGLVYVYLIYGMHWMLNFVTGQNDQPQAILIRGITGFEGPGKITRALRIDHSFYGENLATSERIWVENRNLKPEITRVPRFGIDYAGEPWKSMPWRYIMAPPPRNS
ncbi:MAG: DNA-3-methyladenine glycosylase [Bacteroidales bacterium]|nr:DNA-3-methyladenine glycosylase [Bacteroidales bacterium]